MVSLASLSKMRSSKSVNVPSHWSFQETSSSNPVDMNRVAAIILGGGKGERLFPLTQSRCKPAICFGGRYRLIDIPISNSVNSGCHKIFIITQFLSSSLHQHIFNTYRHDIFSSGFLELLPAEQKPSKHGWFQGTADAVRQNIDYFIETPVDYILILSGDQLYNMNFQKMVSFAKKTDADLVIATTRVSQHDACRMGIFQVDSEQNITNFHEKPNTPEVLANLRVMDDPLAYLGSMGIYLFKRTALLQLLQDDSREDFGKHLIPTKVAEGGVKAYFHDGYWEDIGTIASFYGANMALTKQIPEFNSYNESSPILCNRSCLPGPKILSAQINHSILSEGCIIDAKEISHSILGPRTVIKKGCIIHDSYLMGNEFYTPPIKTNRLPDHLYIDENCVIRKAILDKHVHLGRGVKLLNINNLDYFDGDRVFIRDGVIVVPRGTSLPDNFTI